MRGSREMSQDLRFWDRDPFWPGNSGGDRGLLRCVLSDDNREGIFGGLGGGFGSYGGFCGVVLALALRL